MNELERNSTTRTLENVAIFGGTFVFTQLAEYIGDTIHNPQVMDVPHADVIGLGLVISGLTTAVLDRLHQRER